MMYENTESKLGRTRLLEKRYEDRKTQTLHNGRLNKTEEGETGWAHVQDEKMND